MLTTTSKLRHNIKMKHNVWCH